MNIYIPYTYLIGWSKLNIYYYGVRFSKKCHPDELWVTYFTSSKHVKNFRIEHGEPDIVEVRKTFLNSPETAREWEHKVLRRMKITTRDDFLNKSDGKSIPARYGVENSSTRGCKWFNNGIKSVRVKPDNIQYFIDNEWCSGRLVTDAMKKPKPKSQSIKLSLLKTGTRWYNNGVISKQLNPDNVPDGWCLGKSIL